jgi:hypothetical protein
MYKTLYETEILISHKKEEFLGNTGGRMRELLDRIWTDKFKWGKQVSSCKMGMYDDLKEELEELGFQVFYDQCYGEKMFCISLK